MDTRLLALSVLLIFGFQAGCKKKQKGIYLTGITGGADRFLINKMRTQTPLSDIETINLEKSEITDYGLSFLDSDLTGLKFLYLSKTYITSYGLKNLRSLSSLIRIELSSTEVSDYGLQYLSGLNNLFYLDLSNTQVNDQGLEHLKTLNNLSFLNLMNTNVTDEGIKSISALQNLTELDLSHTKVSDRGLEHLANNKFENLNLSNTRVTSKGINTLHHFPTGNLDLSHTRIQELEFHNKTPFQKPLKKNTDLKCLYSLNLSSTQISDDCVNPLKGFEFIKILYLSRNKISKEFFDNLPKSLEISYVYIDDTEIRAKEVEEIVNKLDCLAIIKNGTVFRPK